MSDGKFGVIGLAAGKELGGLERVGDETVICWPDCCITSNKSRSEANSVSGGGRPSTESVPVSETEPIGGPETAAF